MSSFTANLISSISTFGSTDCENLVLLLHGMDSHVKKVAGLVEAARDELQSSRVLVPELPFSWNKSFDFRELSREVLAILDDEVARREGAPYKRVYIIGHSAGGVLAQAVYLLSRMREDRRGLSTIGDESIQLVLLAPINRGWEISHHLPITHKIAWSLGLLVMTPRTFLAQTFKQVAWEPWLIQLRRGAPFITWLRLSWLRRGNELPMIIQLLGSRDEMVSWRDMVDASTSAKTIFYDVPYSNHAELIEFEDAQYGAAREKLFRNALRKDLEQPKKTTYRIHSLENDEAHPILPWDEEPALPDERVKRVVFVIHGIRDEGYWTQKIANRTRAIFSAEGGGSRDEIAVETSSYGYFSMLQFLLPWERQKKVAWLIDEYVEARRRYPKARFSYIGHSHGTFLAAKALTMHEDVCFERVAFAGSVVNRNYPWRKMLQEGRVASVLNFSASADWVVGIFPKLAQIKPIGFLMGKELGSAGCDPFREAATVSDVHNNEYIKGSHGAAIQENNWDELARFAVHNHIPPETTEEYQDTPMGAFQGWKGWGVCLGMWSVLLFLGAYWFPRAALLSPKLFWGGGMGFILLAIIFIAAIHPFVRGKDYATRKKLQKLSLQVLVGALVCVVLLWCSIPLLEHQVAEEGAVGLVQGRGQMFSMVTYFIVLWNILTKV